MMEPTQLNASELKKANELKKKWLKRYRQLDREIAQKVVEIEAWRRRALNVTPTYRMPGDGAAGQPLTMDYIVARIVDLEAEINADIDRLISLRAEITAAIEVVDDANLRLLLEYRYIVGWTWERIAVKMDYGWRHVHKMHSVALSKIKMA